MGRVKLASIFGVLGLLAPVFFWTAPASAQIIVTPEQPELIESSLIVTSYQVDNGLPSYVQLYNNSTRIAELEGWTINITLLVDAVEVVLPISLNGYLEGESWMVIGQSGLVNGADSEFLLPNDLASDGVLDIKLEREGYTASAYVVTPTSEGRYDLSKSSAGNYTATSKYNLTQNVPLIGGGLYEIPDSTPLRVVAIAANSRNCGPLDKSDDCFEFVKIQNLAAETIDLSMYRLRTGYANQSDSINNTFALSGALDSGEFISVSARNDGLPFDLTASQGNAWIQDKYGLVDYADSVVSYKSIGGNNHIGHAWAYDSDRDKWDWAKSTLQGPNDFNLPSLVVESISTLKPCAPNQYRSLETNRCRLLSTVASTLKPCRTDQYRSQETNRCRSLSSATSTLKPCRADQYRSAETNRCRLLSSETSTLKPCRADQERNPETNRCRKVFSPLANTAFAVEPIKAGTKEFVGWWALGGLTLLGLGYAGWEWRRELANIISRAKTIGNSGN